MKRPEMIIFDYGHTLLYEPQFDFLKGEKAIFKYIKDNPQNVTPEEVCAYGNKLFEIDYCHKISLNLFWHPVNTVSENLMHYYLKLLCRKQV